MPHTRLYLDCTAALCMGHCRHSNSALAVMDVIYRRFETTFLAKSPQYVTRVSVTGHAWLACRLDGTRAQ
jgi:hypothetical protein